MRARWSALPALLLLACSPVAPGDGESESGSPAAESAAQNEGGAAARSARSQTSAKPKVQTGAAYQYVDETGRVRIAASLDEVPERQRATATPVASLSPIGRRGAAPRDSEAAEAGETTPAQVVVYTT